MSKRNDKTPAWLAGTSEAHGLVRHLNWSQHPFGPVADWSASLRTALGICLASRFSMFLWWGPEFRILYNDAYAPTLGIKHPAAFGEPGPEVWEEIWPVIGPMLQHVVDSGEATWSEDQQLFLRRSGYVEETFHTFSYSPVWGDSGEVEGVFTAVTESTKRVLSERRLHTLREVGATTSRARTVEDACHAALRALEGCPADVPFALIYLRDPKRADVLHRYALLNVVSESRMAPEVMHDDSVWPAFAALQSHHMVESALDAEQTAHLPNGVFHEPSAQAATLPIASGEGDSPLGILVLGINSRRPLDEDYRAFLELVSRQIAIAVAKTRALEEEKERAEVLAELDRAKTLFFSNVSHEFRTPLTLMLGPLEDLLHSPDGLPAAQHAELALVHRNALRLLKLVNTLLDFSRIEAGRVEAAYEPSDLSAHTADLASAFRSAVERAGMKLFVDCPPLGEDIFVDRDMWEKIVLNLLSNAFKYTLDGSITVVQTLMPKALRLAVSDTGLGIPEHEIPHLFERFHRVAGVQGRTHEGTGIGLALVQELVKLHRGSVSIQSTVARGSTFTVEIPRGSAHLPAERVQARRVLASTALGADAYVQEALRWLPSTEPEGFPIATDLPTVWATEGLENGTSAQPRIILADDNADMRAYLTNLLAPLYAVEAVANGELALASARRLRPDLIVSDIMMPVLDGLGLVAALRKDPAINTIPVILLSARAGEEARVTGLKSGADDYLVKPFSARELLARVSAHLKMAHLQRTAAAREHDILAKSAIEQARLLARERVAVRYRDEFLGIASHELRTPITSMKLQLQLTERALQRVQGDLHQVPADRLIKMMNAFSRQVGNLTSLIDDLLDVSRIANGRLTIEPKRTDLGLLVTDVLEQTREQLENAACQVTLTAEDNLVGMWDPKRIEQVFVNLLSNAAKYAPGKPVDIVVRADGDTALLSVTDRGTGISLEEQSKVFDRFERAANRLNISGLGLGLYIVKEIVEAHHGEIRLTSTLGEGSEFVVRLPLAS